VGAGAFKETFQATDPAHGRAVALKVYREGISQGRAQREIDAMLRCDHPNVAKLLHVDVIRIGAESHVYCLEEFLAGGTLGAAITTGPMLPAEVRRLIRVLAGALGHLHERGLVHRDLKPENIMLRGDRTTPVIVDLGIVRQLGASSMTPTWAPQGPCTPYFAPAEQLQNEKLLIDWRADQFSLGVTFAWLAFGLHPYASDAKDSADDVITRVATRAAPSQTFVNAANAANLAPLVKMVAPWPVQRFRTPAALIDGWSMPPAN
jgi:serine/threonine protein kinase